MHQTVLSCSSEAHHAAGLLTLCITALQSEVTNYLAQQPVSTRPRARQQAVARLITSASANLEVQQHAAWSGFLAELSRSPARGVAMNVAEQSPERS